MNHFGVAKEKIPVSKEMLLFRFEHVIWQIEIENICRVCVFLCWLLYESYYSISQI